MQKISNQKADKDDKLDIAALWDKYEDIAMHFNDLLMRLRSQSLAGIAAVSTLVGIFTKTGSDAKVDWMAATAIFTALGFFWIAIFFLDLFYYNRLLIGAVEAITDLESKLSNGAAVRINMSTCIEAEFKWSRAFVWTTSRFIGVTAFYIIVLIVIIAGVFFSFHMYTSLN
jgi:hypothetical protein